MKKAISLILALVALTTLIPTAWADDTAETRSGEYEIVTLQNGNALAIQNRNGEQIAKAPDYTLMSVIGDEGDMLQIRWNSTEGWIPKDTAMAVIPRRGVLATEWEWTLEGDWRIHQEVERELLIIEEETSEGFLVSPEDDERRHSFEASREDLTGDLVFVDINLQCAIIYKNYRATIVSPIVSGTKNVFDTPEGIYRVEQRFLGYTLRGEDSGRPYECWVQYWLAFHGAYGLHDADDWRMAYGGDVYTYYGSHGCVNCPRVFAKALYDNCELGSLVVVRE